MFGGNETVGNFVVEYVVVEWGFEVCRGVCDSAECRKGEEFVFVKFDVP
jgi:hypothetical protein